MSGADGAAMLIAPQQHPDDSHESVAAGNTEHNRIIVNGVLWQGALRWLSQVLAWSATIVIARRLTPEDYGIASTATILVGLLSLVSEGGISRALVMRRDTSEPIIRQAHGASMMLGTFLAVMLAIAAYPIGQFYDDRRIVPLILALAPVLMLSGLNATPLAVLQQQLRYRRLAAIEFAKVSAQAVTVMVGAILGYGAWALAGGLLVGHVTAVVFTRRSVRLRALRPVRAVISPTISYARHLVVGSLAWYIYSNADFAVVGRVAGLTALGYYQFAWNMAQLPGEKLGNVLQMVVGPFFGSIGDDLRLLKHYFLLLSELLVSVMLPVLCGFALVSKTAIPLLFGDKWLPAVPIMQILVACAALGSLSTLSHHVLSATGNAATGTRVNLGALVVMPIAFYLAARLSGPMAVASVWLIAQPILMAVPLLKVRQAISLPVRTYLTSLRAPIVSSLGMVLAVLGADKLLYDAGAVTKLAVMCFGGAIIYVAIIWFGFRLRVEAMLAVWRSRR
jgi:teichuronic acid exporter